MTDQTTVTADAASLVRAITNTALFAATDDTLPGICAVRFTATDGTLTAEATDRYVYARETIPCQPGTLDVIDVAVQVKPLVAAIKPFAVALKNKNLSRLAEQPVISISSDNTYVHLTLTGHQAPDLTVTAPLQEGAFPRRAAALLAEAEAKNRSESCGHVAFASKHLNTLSKVVGDGDVERKKIGATWMLKAPPKQEVKFVLGASNKAAVVYVGDSFRALVMPVCDKED